MAMAKAQLAFLLTVLLILLLLLPVVIVPVVNPFPIDASSDKRPRLVGSLASTSNVANRGGDGYSTSSSMLVCRSHECGRVSKLILNSMNRTADPCSSPEDYICGGWKSTFKLPDIEDGWTVSFDGIANTTRNTIKELLEEHTCEDMKTQVMEKRGGFDSWDAISSCLYQTCMDTNKIDSLEASSLLDLLFKAEGPTSMRWLVDGTFDTEKAEMESVEEKRDVISQRLFTIASNLKQVKFFNVYVAMNTLDPSKFQTLHFDDAGLGLSYHLYDAKHKDLQIYYKQHLANLLDMFDNSLMKNYRELWNSYKTKNPNRRDHTSLERAERVFDFEMQLRSIMLSPEDARDVVKYTKPITYGELKQSSPILDLGLIMIPFIQHLTTPLTDEYPLIIRDKKYFENLADKLDKAEWEVIFDYLLVDIVKGYSYLLGKPWSDERDKYQKQRTGADPLPRWRICIEAPPSWVISQSYIKKRFNVRRKEIAVELIADLRKSYGEMLEGYDWLSPETKKSAIHKLSMMKAKTAYPDWFDDGVDKYFTKYYGSAEDALKVSGSYFDSALHFSLIYQEYELSKFGQDKDPTEWYMLPHSVNAYYSASSNEIAIMAALLEEPSVFVWNEEEKDDESGLAKNIAMRSLTYGGVGGVIGHEITHGFDDEGKEYNAEGKLEDDWTESSKAGFNSRSMCIKDQYNKYSLNLLIPDEIGNAQNITLNVRGSLTLGENIADNGGLQIAWKAFSSKLTEAELRAKPLKEFGVDLTTSQLFMFGWGHYWCSVDRPQTLRRRIESDPHSPNRFRTEGPLANFPLFANMYQCPVGSTMNPNQVCRVW